MELKKRITRNNFCKVVNASQYQNSSQCQAMNNELDENRNAEDLQRKQNGTNTKARSMRNSNLDTGRRNSTLERYGFLNG